MRYFKRIKNLPSMLLSAVGRRSRTGSVLILVVVLVVLLALMGTALLSTTRNDRYVSAQNSANTQVDMLIEGVEQVAISTIVADLFDSGNYRPASDSSTPGVNTYDHWDAPYLKQIDGVNPLDKQNDFWLSPRLPTLTYGAGGGPSTVVWSTIGRVAGLNSFDSPFVVGNDRKTLEKTVSTNYTQVLGHDIQLNYVQPSGFSEVFPAWRIFFGGLSHYYVAGDADGDGVGDCGLWKLPVGDIDGVSYYAGVRIIDNSSAVNVNTAYSRYADRTFTNTAIDALGTTVPGPTDNNLGMFRSHVGLAELLYNPGGTDEMTPIDTYRFGSTGITPALQAPVNDPDGTHSLSWAGGGFQFLNVGDLMEHQIARRLDHPGYMAANAVGTSLFTTFGTADAQALAYRFTLSNLSASPSPLESALLGVGTAGMRDSLLRSTANYKGSAVTNLSMAKGRKGYPPNRFREWYDENFNFEGALVPGMAPPAPPHNSAYVRPLRAMLTTTNAVSNGVPVRALPGTIPAAEMTPYRPNTTYPTGGPVKTNINTATFKELYRAFWSVMSDNTSVAGPIKGTPFIDDPGITTNGPFYGMQFGGAPGYAPDTNRINRQFMFRSSIRDMTTMPAPSVVYLPGEEQVKLRAAAAAAQALYLREPQSTRDPDGANHPNLKNVSQTISLNVANATGGPFTATVFAATPQLFIVEVFVWYDRQTAANANNQHAPYVAIKLFNPFPVPVRLGPDPNNPSDQSVWQIGASRRRSGTWNYPVQDNIFNTQPGITQQGGGLETAIQAVGGQTPVIIPPNGVLLLDNDSTGGTNGPLRPQEAWGPATTPPDALEMMTADGSFKYRRIADLDKLLDSEMVIFQENADPNYTGAGGIGKRVDDRVIDSFDFTGFNIAAVPVNKSAGWHYARAFNNSNLRWNCVYPGRYDGSIAGDINTCRQQGTETTLVDTANITADWLNTQHSHLAVMPATGVATATYPGSTPIQLSNHDFPGPNADQAKFPFGGFARNGDILQVPFIAAYSIVDASGAIIEMNGISMDASFAEDTDPTDDPSAIPGAIQEQIGRFCPLTKITAPTGGVVDDFDSVTVPSPNRYAWAKKLFDYLTVQAPSADYFPNAPAPALNNLQAQPVDNEGDGVAAMEDNPDITGFDAAKVGKEDSLGVQGLININTASWKVLSTIPWVPKGQDQFSFDLTGGSPTFANTGNGIDDNEDIAKAIVYWRDGNPDPVVYAPPNGPFKSIFDLYAVESPPTSGNYVFKMLQQYRATVTPDPGPAQGDFSGSEAGGTDGVKGDFEEQYLLLNKVSNLLTVRSDTFTVYVLIQGWRGNSKVVERRAAFIIDRSGVTKEKPTNYKILNIPND